jgi:hypothetical protein
MIEASVLDRSDMSICNLFFFPVSWHNAILQSVLVNAKCEYTKGSIRHEKEQTIQWSKEKVQKDKQRSTKHTCKLNIK